MTHQKNRRLFLSKSLVGGAAMLTGRAMPLSMLAAPAVARGARPQIPYGVQAGDVARDRAIVWSRCDRPARMWIEYDTTDSFKNPTKVPGPAALASDDFTARVDLRRLPAGQDIFYRVSFQDLSDYKTFSDPVFGHFRTAPGHGQNIRFQWSGDTAGQGWGINEEWGGMRIYNVMRQSSPDFFVHCGDTIYADGPIQAEVALGNGEVWKNVTTEQKAKVAETLDEFRGNYVYNLMDANLRAYNAEVPMISQWDDHETTNNWYPQEMLDGDDRYTVKSVALLSERARRAFLEYMPVRLSPEDPERIYRAVHYGPSLDVFVIDLRSYRGPNSPNRQERRSSETAFLGSQQIRWLKQQLLASNATWKVIASDMPIGLVVRDGKTDFENGANGDGPALGREHDIAGLLRFIKYSDIDNVVWLTADVHYTAAHYYEPNQAQFQDFHPFWEFVSGPLNAGSFGPNDLDNTFGPEVRFQKAPAEGQVNLPPSDGLQFFGEVEIDGETQIMTVMLKDLAGETLFSVDLEPA